MLCSSRDHSSGGPRCADRALDPQAQRRPSEESRFHLASVEPAQRVNGRGSPSWVDAGHLSKFQTSCAQAKDASLRYLEQLLLGLCRFDSAERDRPDLDKTCDQRSRRCNDITFADEDNNIIRRNNEAYGRKLSHFGWARSLAASLL